MGIRGHPVLSTHHTDEELTLSVLWAYFINPASLLLTQVHHAFYIKISTYAAACMKKHDLTWAILPYNHSIYALATICLA